MSILESLEVTPIALWVAESFYGYPICLSLHVFGMSIAMGIFTMRDLKIFGMFNGIRTASFLSLGKLAWIGFIVNVVSGFLLFSADARWFLTSTPFLIKIVMIFIAAILSAVIQNKLRTSSSNGNDGTDGSLKFIAMVSTLCWLGAIVSGRLIAYLSPERYI